MKKIVLFVLSLGSILIAHELGHLAGAKALDVAVLQFNVGLPLPPQCEVKLGETIYSFSPWLIAGTNELVTNRSENGFAARAKLLAEKGYSQEEIDHLFDKSRRFSNAPPWKKIVIELLGPAANFFLGFLVLCIVSKLFENEYRRKAAGENIVLRKPMTIFETVCSAANVMRSFLAPMGRSLLKSSLSPRSDERLQSPVGLYRSAPSAEKHGSAVYLTWVAITSFSIGFVNLLPIPPLDGCRLAFAVVELVSGRAVPETFNVIVTVLGVLFLLGLSAYLVVADVLWEPKGK